MTYFTLSFRAKTTTSPTYLWTTEPFFFLRRSAPCWFSEMQVDSRFHEYNEEGQLVGETWRVRRVQQLRPTVWTVFFRWSLTFHRGASWRQRLWESRGQTNGPSGICSHKGQDPTLFSKDLWTSTISSTSQFGWLDHLYT